MCDAKERFFAKTKLATEIRPGMETPCLEWTASTDRDGYGLFWNGNTKRAHRFAWNLVRGAVPSGKCICHRCDNPSCVREDHFFLGSRRENMSDMVGKDRQAKGDAHGSRTHPESRFLHCRGSGHPRAKLTEGNVEFIIRLRAMGWKQERLGAEFGVHQSQISQILSRKKWVHVVIPADGNM